MESTDAHILILSEKEAQILLQENPQYRCIDLYDEQIRELMEIRDPKSVGSTPKPLSIRPVPNYVVYPWRQCIVRILPESEYRELRTNRNKNLLTDIEQQRFSGATIAFAGLNVGNPGAVCIALEGGSTRMKLSDLDPLSVTNLNRFRAGLPDLGVNKAVLTARQIAEIDPYYHLELYGTGITRENMDAFLTEEPIDLLVEEMDALPLKIEIRRRAKQYRIPVIMVTGNSEGVLLDVERYDIEPDLEILNGHLSETVLTALDSTGKPPTPRERVALARDFMGTNVLEKRLIDSFEKFGDSLVGIPQLAESSYLRGAALCYAAKAIILGRELPSGRYAFSFSSHLQKIG